MQAASAHWQAQQAFLRRSEQQERRATTAAA
jgi:hypothetical protein